MLELRREQLVEALQGVGIGQGDGLMVHSAIQYLGRPVGGLDMYLEAIRQVIGPQGTLAVPTFSFSFVRGERFHPQETPSKDMGVFSEYVRRQPEARRTSHPLQSMALLGAQAQALAQLDTPSAFDPGSAFAALLERDFKLLLLGADIHAVSMIHYSEWRAHVPYRYWKDFSGELYTSTGWQTRTYRLFARDLELNPRLEIYKLQEVLEQRGQWASLPLNYGRVASCRLVDFVLAADELLAADPWVFVTNPPERYTPHAQAA